MTNKRQRGALYEQRAMAYLEAKGYKVLTSNYFTKYGEIDIIAYKDGGYIFVEVKYRTSGKYGQPYEAVTRTKKERLMKSAMAFIQSNHGLNTVMRFDIIDILGEVITHYENAFELDHRFGNIIS